MLRKYGGLKFLMEYDGWGLNFGASIPVNHAWTINVALTHFEKLQHFDDLDDGFILPDAPALAFGFQMNIPKLKYQKVQTSIQGLSGMYETMPYDESVDSLVNHASNVINALEDSILIQQQSKEQLINRNQLLSVQIKSLEDSLNQSQFNQKVLERNLNLAMKHLSISLQAYYAKNYSVALEETDKAINIFPNLAIAYARKGSIYYQLGDTNRATINWNIALKLDPDYTEVKEVLLKLKNEGSLYLKSTTLPE
jgi:tetratricopeptide (TPR) repeat protein